MKELLKALSNVKKEAGKLSKTETNPFFKSKYFDINSLIDQVEPLLEKNGLLLLQPIEDNHLVSTIYHIDSEEYVSSSIALPQLNDPQKLGSAITYYRRYTLQSLLGLQAEDDDGNKASQQTKPQLTNIQRMNNCKTLAELQQVFTSIFRPSTAEVELKDKLKLTLK